MQQFNDPLERYITRQVARAGLRDLDLDTPDAANQIAILSDILQKAEEQE